MSLDFYALPGFNIRRLHQISVSIFDDAMAKAEIDLTQVQYAALSALAAEPHIDQGTLAGLIAYDRVTIGGVVDRLVAKGLASRAVSPTDRRARILEITPAGEELLRRVKPVVRRLQRAILNGLTREEQDLFMALILKLTDTNNARSKSPLRRTQ